MVHYSELERGLLVGGYAPVQWSCISYVNSNRGFFLGGGGLFLSFHFVLGKEWTVVIFQGVRSFVFLCGT